MLAIDSYHYYERVAIAVQNFKRDDFVFIASMDAAFQMTCQRYRASICRAVQNNSVSLSYLISKGLFFVDTYHFHI